MKLPMSVNEFNKLNLQKKADFVLEWGFFIGSKKRGECNTVVYYLGNFLAEVSYLVSETKNIKVLKAVELKEYLNHFDYKNIFFIQTLTGIQSKYRVW